MGGPDLDGLRHIDTYPDDDLDPTELYAHQMHAGFELASATETVSGVRSELLGAT